MNKKDIEGIGKQRPEHAKSIGHGHAKAAKAKSGKPESNLALPRPALSREAKRLLEALGLPEAQAFVDPTDAAEVILRKRRAAVTVGAGRFSKAAADTLARQDLARWEAGSTGSDSLSLTEAGRAHLRRVGAPEPEVRFFHQHRHIEEAVIPEKDGRRRVRVDTEESPLDWLRRRKGRDGQPLIDDACYQAGERLRADIMLAGFLPGVTARWDGMPSQAGTSGPTDATDRMVAARQRLRHAFDAVGGDFSDLLMDLCGFLKGLELIERERQWPPRSAKIVVRMALARLAEHYGIEATAQGPAASRGIRTWKAVVIDGGRP
ncbi:DUF6456 domain-containing protein [Microvirga rosea]|uniref:DUF6456 domain-containing protein n=1 Tax=Microvirga rosea TaxID=2715425 RepID=UPI001D09A6C1|nr:DUF6456 domain-containing protein [Microvirga rosea]MCB8820090.1 DUF6456 domain-containing protein [Microvirga rosea]